MENEKQENGELERARLCEAAKTAHESARSALISSLSGDSYLALIAKDYRVAANACLAVAEAYIDARTKLSNSKRTIEEIQAMPIIGDAYHDGPLLQACHDFIADDSNAMEDKIKAIEKIDETMGEKSEKPITEKDVNSYIKESC